MDSKGIIAQPFEKAGIGKYIAEYILLVGDILMAITMENHGLYFDKYKPFDWDIRVKSDVLSDRETNMLQNYCKHSGAAI